MAVNRLKPPRNLRIEFKPSPRQYELWKLLQPNYCPHCGGEIEQILIGYDQQGNPQYRPQCRHCKSQNLPQLILGGGAAGGGKSYIGSVWLVSSCIRFENIRAVVARKTLKSLKESTWNTIKSILKDWGLKEDTNYKINNLEGTLTFWNDSVIIMKEMADILFSLAAAYAFIVGFAPRREPFPASAIDPVPAVLVQVAAELRLAAGRVFRCLRHRPYDLPVRLEGLLRGA